MALGKFRHARRKQGPPASLACAAKTPSLTSASAFFWNEPRQVITTILRTQPFVSRHSMVRSHLVRRSSSSFSRPVRAQIGGPGYTIYIYIYIDLHANLRPGVVHPTGPQGYSLTPSQTVKRFVQEKGAHPSLLRRNRTPALHCARLTPSKAPHLNLSFSLFLSLSLAHTHSLCSPPSLPLSLSLTLSLKFRADKHTSLEWR